MKKDRIGESIRHKVYMALMSIERASCCEGSVDLDTCNEIMADSVALSNFPAFRAVYDSKNGAGAIWLQSLIDDARKPYPVNGPLTVRELFRWVDLANGHKKSDATA